MCESSTVHEIYIETTHDTGLVQQLLERWKTVGHAYSESDRMVFRVARVVASGEPAGVLVGTHDFGNWSVLDLYQHLGSDDHGSYVQAMWVDPAQRSHGVGSALLQTFIAEARGVRSPVVIVWPDEDEEGRAARLRFFERHGFTWMAFPGGAREPWLMGRPL